MADRSDEDDLGETDVNLHSKDGLEYTDAPKILSNEKSNDKSGKRIKRYLYSLLLQLMQK